MRISALVAALLFWQTIALVAANHVDTSRRNRIVIRVPIDLISGEDEVASRWNQAIKDHWNRNDRGRPFEYCGKTVQFEPDIQPIARGARGRPDAHRIVMRLPARDGSYRVSTVRWSGGFNPQGNATGFWSQNDSDQIIAHEFGHVLGIPDEYFHLDVPDANGVRNGRRDAHEQTRPRPECRDSLMATGAGQIQQRHIDEVMRRHGLPGCEEWSGWLKVTITAETVTFDITARVSLKHDGQGNVTGTVEGDVPFVKTGGIPCDASVLVPGKTSANVVGQYTASQQRMSLSLTETRSEPGRYSMSCAGRTMTGTYGEYAQGGTFNDPVVERLLRRLEVGSAGSVNDDDEGQLAAHPASKIKVEISLHRVEQ